MSSHDKVALVTGGGTGVGRATVLQLAHHGFDVAINYSRSETDAVQTRVDVEQLGRQAVTIKCDVSRDDEVRRMIQQCREHFGRLDALVNNAATTHFVDLPDLEGMTESMWDDILGVNLKGAFFVSRAAVDLLKNSEIASIVNVASIAGIAGAGSSIAYAASKGGLITMTKSLARALAPSIRVNAICPGVIISRWLKDFPDMVERAIEATPLQKASTTDDVADAIIYLTCHARNVTGQSVVVDGGLTM